MVHIVATSCLAVCVLIYSSTISLAVEVPLSDHTFDGFDSQFILTKNNLQKIVDRVNSQSGPDDVKFYIPDHEKYTHIHYAVYVAFGQVTTPSFEESMSQADLEKINTSHNNLHFYIPFISSTVDGPPEFRLELLSFTSSHDHFVSPNVIFDSQPADVLEFEVNDDIGELTFQSGDLELHMTRIISDECVSPPPPQDVQELEASVGELGITQNIPDFSICDELTNPECNKFCIVAEKLADVIDISGSNVCLRWTPVVSTVHKYEAILYINYISQSLKDILGLGEDHPKSLIAEKMRGLFNINLKVPCVE